MDLSFSAAEDAFRAAVRTWLASHLPAAPLPSMDTAEGFEAHRRWERELYEERYSVVSWPAEYGGRGASIIEWLVFEEEYWAAGAPGRVSQNGINLLAPSMMDHGTAEQKARFLPAMASGEQIWAQVWSEPEAGSDLASLRSTAVRAPSDDGWLLSGQKTWSSRATFADWGFGLFRSDPAAERHRGLTYFLFALTAPGIIVRPIAQFDGEPGFAELFFDGVYVPDADVLGAVGDGWKVTMATAGKERGLYLRSPGRYLATAARLVALWKACGRPAEFRDRVAEAWIGARAYQLATFETAARIADGGTLGAETSVNKLFWSELDLAMHETALDLLGPEAERADSAWMDGYLFALAGPIYAGTNEVQRNVVAERVLGLPRGGAVRFALTAEQRDFRDAVDSLLRDANGVAAARAWGAGNAEPGLEIWRGLAGIGLHSLAGEYPVELCAAMERVGYHAAPGPYPESLAVATVKPEWREQLAGGTVATVAMAAVAPWAPNADIADLCLSVISDVPVASLDPARSLFAAESAPANDLLLDTAALLTAAQLLGLGRAALDMAVAYAKQRVQYGHVIGEYQAVKHRLADAHTGLEFARPLVFAAALSSDSGDVSAAKAATSDAAYRAARAALQVHGAVGYTEEYDLSVYFKKIRALYSAWGSPSFHRDRLLRCVGDF